MAGIEGSPRVEDGGVGWGGDSRGKTRNRSTHFYFSWARRSLGWRRAVVYFGPRAASNAFRDGGGDAVHGAALGRRDCLSTPAKLYRKVVKKKKKKKSKTKIENWFNELLYIGACEIWREFGYT